MMNPEQLRYSKPLAILLATAATLWACGALAYVRFIRLLPPFDPTVELVGLMVSLSGLISGAIALRFPPRKTSAVAITVSALIFVLFAAAVAVALISGKSSFHRSVTFPWAQ